MKRIVVLLATLGALACARAAWSGDAAVTPRPSGPGAAHPAPAKGGQDWLAYARAEAGGEPVLLTAPDATHVVARTPADRPPLAQITLPTAASALAFDPSMDLVWVRNGAVLSVIDLRTPAPKPEPIVTGLAESDVGVPSIWITRSKGGAYTLVPDYCTGRTGLRLNWTRKPSLEGGAATGVLIGKSWLDVNLDRPLRDVPQPELFEPPGHFTVVKIPSRRGCSDPSACGRAVEFGNTGLKLVQVKLNEEKCPGAACLLHDPKTGEFASPPVPTAWAPFARAKPASCGWYRFDKARDRFTAGNTVCTMDACAAVQGKVLGWLEPGPDVGTPE